MSTSNPHDPNKDTLNNENESAGFETTDVSIPGILVFLASLAISVVVFFALCFGMGKIINNGLVKHDGPANKWKAAGTAPGKLMEMQTNPQQQQKELAQLTQRFPTPRLEIDDGNQDLADLHAREGLLLDHYSWVDRNQGIVRIPIDQAMLMIVKRGLPVASAAEGEPLMTADVRPHIRVPLTTGFVLSGYEQEIASSEHEPRHEAKNESHQSKTQDRAELKH